MNSQLRPPSFHRQYDAVSRCINDTNCCCNLLVIYIHSMKLLFQSLVYLIINLLLYYIFRRFDCCFLWIFLWIIYHNILHILLIRIYFWIYCIALYCTALYQNFRLLQESSVIYGWLSFSFIIWIIHRIIYCI